MGVSNTYVTETVEMGHSLYTGGSITISVEVYNDEEKDYIKSMIDTLDHTLVTTSPELVKFSSRFYFLESSDNIFDDINSILLYRIGRKPGYRKIKISYNDIEYNSVLGVSNIGIIACSTEG